jgi:rhodanese-related sulfurtransferase
MGNKNRTFITLLIFVALAAVIFSVLAGCSSTSTITQTSPPVTRQEISVNDAHTLIEANQSDLTFVILDVRTPGEYADGHIENSVLVDFQAPAFRDEVARLDKGKTYLVYCRTGNRSAGASDVMVGLGFTDVYNMTGGITAWQAAGFPVVK